MKEEVQSVGVRKWFGDDIVSIQDEINAVLAGLFGHYSTPFILKGCEVNGNDIAEGIVGLIHADGFKMCRFAGTNGVVFPIYLKPVKTEQTRDYRDGAVRAISNTYTAETSDISGAGYLEIKADGSTVRFNDIIQDATHRMVSDAEKANYAGQAASAIAMLRDGIAAEINTLEKLRAYLENLIPSEVNLQALYDYIDGLTYLPTFQGTSNLSGNIIDWTGTPERTKTLTEAVELDATDLIVGKTIGLKVSGAFALTFAAKFVKVTGSPSPVTTATNYIQMKCLNATASSELIVYTVMYLP